jgi:hypothetical protein
MTVNDERRRVRARLLAKSPKDKNGHALCWRCKARRATDMHEIVNRAVTVGNEQARALSFEEGLCLMLCRPCHDEAPTRSVERELWLILYERYGEDVVRTAYAKVQDAMRGTLAFDLPEPN